MNMELKTILTVRLEELELLKKEKETNHLLHHTTSMRFYPDLISEDDLKTRNNLYHLSIGTVSKGKSVFQLKKIAKLKGPIPNNLGHLKYNKTTE